MEPGLIRNVRGTAQPSCALPVLAQPVCPLTFLAVCSHTIYPSHLSWPGLDGLILGPVHQSLSDPLGLHCPPSPGSEEGAVAWTYLRNHTIMTPLLLTPKQDFILPVMTPSFSRRFPLSVGFFLSLKLQATLWVLGQCWEQNGRPHPQVLGLQLPNTPFSKNCVLREISSFC